MIKYWSKFIILGDMVCGMVNVLLIKKWTKRTKNIVGFKVEKEEDEKLWMDFKSNLSDSRFSMHHKSFLYLTLVQSEIRLQQRYKYFIVFVSWLKTA